MIWLVPHLLHPSRFSQLDRRQTETERERDRERTCWHERGGGSGGAKSLGQREKPGPLWIIRYPLAATYNYELCPKGYSEAGIFKTAHQAQVHLRLSWGSVLGHTVQIVYWLAWPELFSLSLLCVCGWTEGRGLRWKDLRLNRLTKNDYKFGLSFDSFQFIPLTNYLFRNQSKMLAKKRLTCKGTLLQVFIRV